MASYEERKMSYTISCILGRNQSSSRDSFTSNDKRGECHILAHSAAKASYLLLFTETSDKAFFLSASSNSNFDKTSRKRSRLPSKIRNETVSRRDDKLIAADLQDESEHFLKHEAMLWRIPRRTTINFCSAYFTLSRWKSAAMQAS